MAEPVLVEPLGGAVAEHRRGDRVHAAREALARDHDVRFDPVLRDGPHLAGAHEARLDLVGDVERVVAHAEVLDRLEVARRRQGEAVRRGDGLHDHGGDVAAAHGLFHRVHVTERHLDELVGLIGEEEFREPIVAGGDRETGVAVIGLDDRDDLAALGGVAGTLERDVDGLATAGAEGHLADRRRRGLDESLRQRGAGDRREVVIADVEVRHAVDECLHHFGIAVAQVVGAAVQVHVDEPATAHVPEEVALPAVDDQIDPGVGPELRLVRVPERLRPFQHLGLGLERECAVVVRDSCGEFVGLRRTHPKMVGPFMSMDTNGRKKVAVPVAESIW